MNNRVVERASRHFNIKCITLLTIKNMRHTAEENEEEAHRVSRRLLDDTHSQSAALSDMKLKPPRRPMVRLCFTR
jgi:hypothetical protein